MNVEIVFQLISLLLVLALGPIIIVLLTSQKGNL